MFDFTVNLGNLLTIISFLVGGVAFVYTIKFEVRSIQSRLADVEVDLRKLTDVLVNIARQDERMNYMSKEIQELKKSR
jgi:hypothetical protein